MIYRASHHIATRDRHVTYEIRVSLLGGEQAITDGSLGLQVHSKLTPILSGSVHKLSLRRKLKIPT